MVDKNLLVLVILSAFSDSDFPLDHEFARALLSNVLNENIDRSSFDNILSSLAETGYVVEGKVIQVTSRGEAVSRTLGSTSLNRYDVDYIRKNVERFVSGTSESRSQQTESLLGLVNKQTVFSGQLVEKIPSDKLVSNSVKLVYKTTDVPIIVNEFDAPFVKGLRSQSDRFRTLKWIERAVEEKIGETVVVLSSLQGFTVYSSVDVEAVSTTELNFKRSRKETKRSIAEVPQIQKEFVLKSLARRFNERGFGKVGYGRRFIDFSSHRSEPSDLGTFRYYDGFDFRLDTISESVSVAWFDPTVKRLLTLCDYMDNLGGHGYNDADILRYLKDELVRVRVLPSEGKGKILSVSSLIDINEGKVPGTELSFKEYWKTRHQFALTRDRQPIVEIQLGDSTYNYPAETAYLDRDDIEDLSDEISFQGSTALSPPERISRTGQMISTLLSSPIEDKFYTVDFGTRLLTWAELSAERYCSGFSRLSPPNLRFNIERQMTQVTNDPRSIFKFGPYSKEKSGSVNLVVPVNSPVGLAEQSFRNLSSSYKRLGFGTLELSDNMYRYSPSIETSKLSNLVSGIRKKTRNSIALVILPANRPDLYLPFKEEIFRVAAMPAQIVLTSTFERIANGEPGPTRGLILQIYTKLLGKKEAAWILADPADQKMETMYVGIGFSSTPYSEKRANSFAAMCDPKGGEIDWKPVGVPFEGRYIDEKWFEGFLRFVKDNVRPGVKRIVVFRKGDTYENERKAMEKIVAGLTEGPWSDFNFVSVINEERRIIALQEMAQNPESGVFVTLNDKEAILVCSLQHGIPLQQGTTIPIRLVKVIGESSVEKIVSEYRALTYLNWASPISTSKYPLVVNIANRIAQLVKEQADVKMLETYLPL